MRISSFFRQSIVFCDRMAQDCGLELRKDNVAFVSLWPGAVRTENILDMLNQEREEEPEAAVGGGVKISREQVARMFQEGETPEFAGKAVVHLASDPNIMKKSGRVQVCAELAEEYGFKDIDGRSPPNFRRVKDMCSMFGYTGLAAWIPAFIKIPFWVLAAATHKF